MKITALNAIAQVGLDQLPASYEMTDNFAEADAALVRSANMKEMELPANLLAIARAGAGVNNIPLEKCAQQGIVVFNTPGANANGVKELAIAGLILGSRDIVGGVNWVESISDDPNIAKTVEKGKKQFVGTEIMGKKLGVIGLGAIGAGVANAATLLGMDVYGYDPFISVKAAWSLSKEVKHITNVEDIFATCDYISLHVPLMDSTRGMINEEAFAKMKDGVIILNLARDTLVDFDALEAALDSGKVRKYVTDFPNPRTENLEGVLTFPHLGASTVESEDNCAVMAAAELADFLDNGNITHSVNYPDINEGVCTSQGRIAICHKNKPGMLSRVTSICSDSNIDHLSNKSRGDWAYTLIDLSTPLSDKVLAALESIDGVVRVRKIK